MFNALYLLVFVMVQIIQLTDEKLCFLSNGTIYKTVFLLLTLVRVPFNPCCFITPYWNDVFNVKIKRMKAGLTE